MVVVTILFAVLAINGYCVTFIDGLILWGAFVLYIADTLLNEYTRDVKAGINPDIPVNYFPDDDDTKEPICTWRSSANLLYCNWLNYFVYQATPFDLTKVGVVLMDDHMPAWIRDEKN